MSAEDLEKYETEMELSLYREYKDIVGQFSYVVETERRFYLANSVEMVPRNTDGEVYFELRLTDAWVWDMYRPARFVKQVRVPAAAAYATYLADGEPEAARTARFVEVTRLALAKLPVEATKTEAILTGLGASARSTISTKDLAAFLVKMHEYVLADNVAYNSLPTVAADAGGATPGQRIDQTAASAMVDKYFPDAKRKPGPNSKTRVLVQNGGKYLVGRRHSYVEIAVGLHQTPQSPTSGLKSFCL